MKGLISGALILIQPKLYG